MEDVSSRFVTDLYKSKWIKFFDASTGRATEKEIIELYFESLTIWRRNRTVDLNIIFLMYLNIWKFYSCRFVICKKICLRYPWGSIMRRLFFTTLNWHITRLVISILSVIFEISYVFSIQFRYRHHDISYLQKSWSLRSTCKASRWKISLNPNISDQQKTF